MEMKMITIANQKRTGFVLTMTLALFLSVICSASYAADNASPGATASEQQNNKVTGKVVDEQGQPVIGANVLLKGSTTVGDVTGADGSFTLTVPANSTLEVSYIGFVPMEINVGTRSSLGNIVLKTDAQAIDEVIVTGYGAGQKKSTVTSAISTIGSKEISRSMASNASGAIAGKVAGVSFRQNDGRPGNGATLRVRNAQDPPLYVIDGIPVDEGKFNQGDFNDIEQFTVLKDGAAAAYGVRGSNGVVIITTKRGKLGDRNTVSIDGYYGLANMNLFPDVANAYQYVTAKVQSDVLSGANPSFSPEDGAKWKAGTEKGFRGFDWKGFIFRTAPQKFIKASVSGGSESTNYYISFAHTDHANAFRGYGSFLRENYIVNIDTRIGKRLKISVSLDGYIEQRARPGVPGGDDLWLPRFGVFKNLPTQRPYANDNPDYPAMTNSELGVNFALLNSDIAGRVYDTWRNHNYVAAAEYDIMTGMKFRLQGGYTFANHYSDNHEYTFKTYAYDEATDTYYVPQGGAMNNPYREIITEQNVKYFGKAELTFNRRFGNHGVNAVVAMETEQEDTPGFTFNSTPIANTMHLIRFPQLKSIDHRPNRTRKRAGLVVSANYDYANKYIASFTGRYDASSYFASDKRWGFFPSGSLAWRISEENFWKNGKINNVLNDFKVRASYGIMGSENGIGQYDFFGGYNYPDGQAVFDGKVILGSKARGLPSILTWQKVKTTNVGLDFEMFNGKLSGQVDYFVKWRTGMPTTPDDIVIPQEVGFNVPQQNLNSEKLKGMDGRLTWSDNIGEVQYSVGGNFTYSRFYDWDRYHEQLPSNSWQVYRDYKVHRFGYTNWGWQADGRFTSWEEIANYGIDNDERGNRETRPGDIKYKDVNGDGMINGMDDRPIGYRSGYTPVLTFGINLGASWKGIDLSADFTGSAYGTYTLEHEMRNPFQNSGNLPEHLLNQWRLSDPWDANSELIPGYFPTSIAGQASNRRYANSTFWVKNVTYLKLKNLQLGYNLPKAWLDKASIQQVRIYFAAQNLFTIDNLPVKIDPETTDTNGLQYPNTRVLSLGVNLKF